MLRRVVGPGLPRAEPPLLREIRESVDRGGPDVAGDAVLPEAGGSTRALAPGAVWVETLLVVNLGSLAARWSHCCGIVGEH